MPQVGLTGLLRLSLFIVNGVEEFGLDKVQAPPKTLPIDDAMQKLVDEAQAQR